MNNFTKNKLEKEVFAPMARTYGVKSVGRQFSISPTHAQVLNDKIVEQSTFLPHINILPVRDIAGENILGSVSGPIASRTDTTGDGERKAKHVLTLEGLSYELAQTNSDVAIRYKLLDTWSKFPDLHQRYMNYVQERLAADRELVGWYGEKAAKNTNLETNPLLQDVNKGWIEYVRENKPENIFGGLGDKNEIRIGKDGDYSCLDVAVDDLLKGIPYYKQKDLVALIGRDLITREKTLLLEAVQGTPTEKKAMDSFAEKFGNLPWMSPSFFPARGLIITSLKNLSIYYQEDSWRRKIEDNPKKDQLEDYLSRNEGYVVEDPEAFVSLEFDNVKIPMKQPDGSFTWV